MYAEETERGDEMSRVYMCVCVYVRVYAKHRREESDSGWTYWLSQRRRQRLADGVGLVSCERITHLTRQVLTFGVFVVDENKQRGEQSKTKGCRVQTFSDIARCVSACYYPVTSG